MHGAAGAPQATATVIRYREGWGMLAGALLVCGFVGSFGYFLVNPDDAVRGGGSFVPWLVVIVFGPLALLFLALALFFVSVPQRLHVDERGLWHRMRKDANFIAWAELSGLRGQEPQPKRKDDPDSEPVPGALVFDPVDAGFAERHAGLLDRRAPEGCHRMLLRRGVVRRIVRAVSDRRPDLLR
ncbi:hypothetical protein [Saccharopolyspora sp. CA-218241]|uniref:hypothetical protein n=1 Tax=Saccharopolyspora sp. CA-218241 TaxID=3240027 RepID=UPI003D998F9A